MDEKQQNSLDRLQEFLDSDEGKAYFEEKRLQEERRDLWKQRTVDFIEHLDHQSLDSFMNKLIVREERKKEMFYKRGVESETMSFYLVCDALEKLGTAYRSHGHFSEYKYRWRGWETETIHGQGSITFLHPCYSAGDVLVIEETDVDVQDKYFVVRGAERIEIWERKYKEMKKEESGKVPKPTAIMPSIDDVREETAANREFDSWDELLASMVKSGPELYVDVMDEVVSRFADYAVRYAEEERKQSHPFCREDLIDLVAAIANMEDETEQTISDTGRMPSEIADTFINSITNTEA